MTSETKPDIEVFKKSINEINPLPLRIRYPFGKGIEE